MASSAQSVPYKGCKWWALVGNSSHSHFGNLGSCARLCTHLLFAILSLCSLLQEIWRGDVFLSEALSSFGFPEAIPQWLFSQLETMKGILWQNTYSILRSSPWTSCLETTWQLLIVIMSRISATSCLCFLLNLSLLYSFLFPVYSHIHHKVEYWYAKTHDE